MNQCSKSYCLFIAVLQMSVLRETQQSSPIPQGGSELETGKCDSFFATNGFCLFFNLAMPSVLRLRTEKLQYLPDKNYRLALLLVIGSSVDEF